MVEKFVDLEYFGRVVVIGFYLRVLLDFLFKNECKYFAFLNIMCIFARNKIKSILNLCLHLLPIKSLWMD